MLGGFLHICIYTCTIYCVLWPSDNTSCIFLTWYQSPARVPRLTHLQLVRINFHFFSTVVFFTAVGLPWPSLGGRPSLVCPVPWWPPFFHYVVCPVPWWPPVSGPTAPRFGSASARPLLPPPGSALRSPSAAASNSIPLSLSSP
jgi:hypothetical protein